MLTLDQRLGPGFAKTLVDLSLHTRVDPLGAAGLMLNESGLISSLVASNGAVGINMLLKSNYGVFAPLTLAQYRSLTATEQLPYVFGFWRGLIHDFGKHQAFFSGRDLYWLNFLPAFFVPNAPDSYVISKEGDAYYSSNLSLDHGNKGFITAGDMQLAINAATARNAPLWSQIKSAVGQRGVKFVARSTTALALIAAAGLAIGFVAYGRLAT